MTREVRKEIGVVDVQERAVREQVEPLNGRVQRLDRVDEFERGKLPIEPLDARPAQVTMNRKRLVEPVKNVRQVVG
jgi:hypothetical protein